MILYSIGRFFIEGLRNDPRGSVGPFSTSQFISLLIFAAGVLVMVLASRQKPREVAEVARSGEEAENADPKPEAPEAGEEPEAPATENDSPEAAEKEEKGHGD